MSYSRWGGSCWYTFWAYRDYEDRDNALFEVCPVTQFTAKELRDNIDECLTQAVVAVIEDGASDPTEEELAELKGYMEQFLADVDEKYPLECDRCGQLGATRRRQNTAYNDDSMNWNTLCEDCQKNVDEYWADMWDEYYGSRL